MNEVLSEVNKKYCAGDCDSGPVAASIGYLSPGTSLDWVNIFLMKIMILRFMMSYKFHIHMPGKYIETESNFKVTKILMMLLKLKINRKKKKKHLMLPGLKYKNDFL